jgi:hypothetical protein
MTSGPAATDELQVKPVELWAPVWFVDPIEVGVATATSASAPDVPVDHPQVRREIPR